MGSLRRLGYRLLKLPPRALYALGLGPVVGRWVLLLTTTGRRSGRPRITPLQYEEIDGVIYVGAARGPRADWVRNINAEPTVEVRLGTRRFDGHAELTTDPAAIADFLAYRFRRHPRMVGAILRRQGVSIPPDRPGLEAYARRLVLVAIHRDRA